MKKYSLLLSAVFIYAGLQAQTDTKKYPEPEFANEIYFLKKDSVNSVIRLEKNSSKMETKTKAAGFGGSETGYTFDGEKSPVRFHGGNFSFVFSTGASSSTNAASNPGRDSAMRANGMDPSLMQSSFGGFTDPANTITLYKVETEKSERKIILQKTPGTFGGKKIISSDKYTFSLKKIREGYWELMVDKPLSKGEYAFTIMNMMSMDVTGGRVVFAFGVD